MHDDPSAGGGGGEAVVVVVVVSSHWQAPSRLHGHHVCPVAHGAQLPSFTPPCVGGVTAEHELHAEVQEVEPTSAGGGLGDGGGGGGEGGGGESAGVEAWALQLPP